MFFSFVCLLVNIVAAVIVVVVVAADVPLGSCGKPAACCVCCVPG